VKEQSVAKLRRRIEQLSEVYTLPSTLLEILMVSENPESSSRDLSRCVERDQAVAMKLLKVANSAYEGLRQRVSSIPLAVHLLGPREVVCIATSVSVFRLLGGSYRDDRFDLGTLWRHSMHVAAVAGLLADRLGRKSTGTEFAAGLLHDIGKVVIAQELRDELVAALDLVDDEGIALTEAETRVLGATHAEVGGWLATEWEFPPRLVEAIAYHHRPMAVLSAVPPTTDPALTAIVYLADAATQPVDEEQPGVKPVDSETIETAKKLIVLEHSSVDSNSLAVMLEGISDSVERADRFRTFVETAEL